MFGNPALSAKLLTKEEPIYSYNSYNRIGQLHIIRVCHLVP